jgi:hypothetical protein
VTYEVDVQEVGHFLLCQTTLYSEEPAVERLGADAGDGLQELSPVIRSLGPDLDPTSIAKRLEGLIRRCRHHGRPSSNTLFASMDAGTPLASHKALKASWHPMKFFLALGHANCSNRR